MFVDTEHRGSGMKKSVNDRLQNIEIIVGKIENALSRMAKNGFHGKPTTELDEVRARIQREGISPMQALLEAGVIKQQGRGRPRDKWEKQNELSKT